MKVTKTKEDIDCLKRLKKTANKDCNKCPCCGENKTTDWYIKHKGKLNKGISQLCFGKMIIKKFKYYQIDKYCCNTCGAEWQSEPYQIKL